jgi:hypothetical protein
MRTLKDEKPHKSYINLFSNFSTDSKSASNSKLSCLKKKNVRSYKQSLMPDGHEAALKTKIFLQ